MAGKKYLSLEEAAELIGVRPDEVMRLREKGELRGFADRGTWKFKADDVTEAKRRRQPDSSPDVGLISDDDDGSILSEPRGRERNTSDSDVRLVLDQDLKSQLTGSSGDVPVLSSKPGSDSDVRLVGAPEKGKPGSDSDVKLIKTQGAKSGVKLSTSDSDVRLAPAPGSDSDVKLAKPGSHDSILSGGDDVLGGDFSDSILLDDDSGIALQSDSGLRLSGESGIQLRRPQDSGILLEGSGSFKLDDDDAPFKLADDSGIKVGDDAPTASSKQRSKAAGTDSEIQTQAVFSLDDDDGDRTDPEVPLLMDDEDDLMPKSFSLNDETQAETSVVMFDDDDDDNEASVTISRKKGQGGLSSKELETAAFDLDAEDETDDEVLDADDDSFADEDLEEVLTDDDEDFSDSFSDEGMSAAEIATTRGGRVEMPAQSEWGSGMVMLLVCSTAFMIAGAWMATDLLSTVFASGTPVYQGPFVEAIGGLFK